MFLFCKKNSVNLYDSVGIIFSNLQAAADGNDRMPCVAFNKPFNVFFYSELQAGVYTMEKHFSGSTHHRISGYDRSYFRLCDSFNAFGFAYLLFFT